ncbi:uncharacterized protein LOC114757071 [Neltuma alba]|uniref:uncharacterized protein LOC114757071 n=1 Tax=Neltuma alba TaxID=207710 RepID=UPI0010A58EF0|nr:uncharacterized protein LOC114757071 [Prosopis alba]
MSNLTKLEFVALDITGKNYLSWVLDAEIHLNANGLGDTIKAENKASSQEKAKAMIFLRHHLHEGLKMEYLTIKDPLVLWNNLKERYDHQKTVILPKARYEWMHLRLQDFKSVSEYNSAIFRISSQLKLCGEKVTDEDMLEKTFSTFHVSNVLLQQQYREKGFKKYSELISCLLVAEQNNELLMKNHESRPTGSTPFPKANVVVNGPTRGRGRGHGRARGRRIDRGRGRGHNRGGSNSYSKRTKNDENRKRKTSGSNNHSEDSCYRCGGNGHWSRTCRTPKHLVDLYQESLKNKSKGNGKMPRVETNFVDEEGDLIMATWMSLIWILLISLLILMERLIT